MVLVIMSTTIHEQLDEKQKYKERYIICCKYNNYIHAYVGRNSVSSIGQNQSLTSLLN